MKPNVLLFLFLLIFYAPILLAASAGDFRSKTSGNWNQATTWQYYNGSSWVNATYAPSYLDGEIDVLAGHNVTITANVTIDEVDVAGYLTINAGVAATLNDGYSTDLSISNRVFISGTLIVRGTIVNSAEELVIQNGGLYQYNRDGGTIDDATWNDGSTCEINGILSSSSLSGANQSFYHFKWNCPSQTSETNLAGDLETIRGNLIMASTGSGNMKMGQTADYILTITGNWIHQNGVLNMGGGSSNAYINLYGNFTMEAGKITEYNSASYISKITFTKSGTQILTKTGGIFENNIDFEVQSGCTLDMGESVIDGSLGMFSLNGGATLKTAHSGGIASSGATGCIRTTNRYLSSAAHFHYCRNGSQVTGTGLPSPLSGKLMIGSASAATSLTITNGSTSVTNLLLLCSNTISNSVITSGTIVYGSSATLEYQGMSAQTTALKEWPSSLGPFNVILNNPFGVSLNFSRTITGNLNIVQGNFGLGSNTLQLNGTLTYGTGTLAGTCSSTLGIGGNSGVAIDISNLTLGNLNLNRPGGIRLTGNVSICTTMVMTAGSVTQLPGNAISYQSESRLIYNGTGDQSTAAEEFPLLSGPPSLEVDKPSGTTLNLQFSRTLTESLILKGGIFSIGPNSLTLSGTIVNSGGSLLGGSASGIQFAPGASAGALPAVQLGNLTIHRNSGVIMNGDCLIYSTLTLLDGPFSIGANTLTLYGDPIAGNPLLLTSNPASGLFIGGSSPSFQIPQSITQLGSMMIANPSGVEISGSVEISNALTIQGKAILHDHVLSGPGFLNVFPGSMLVCAHPEGIAGNLVMTGPAMVDGNVDYEFNGQVDQVTGFLPTTPPETIRVLFVHNFDQATLILNSNFKVMALVEVGIGSTMLVDFENVLTILGNLIIH